MLTNPLAMAAIDGRLDLNLSFSSEQLSAYKLTLNDINLVHKNDSGSAKYAFDNLNAEIAYSGQDSMPGYIRFDQARLFDKVEFSNTNLALQADKNAVSVANNSQLSIFDGELLFDKFRMAYEDQKLNVDFQGVLTPVSLQELTTALDWPPMQGKISGVIPEISYSDGQAKLAGTMLVKVFDGDILFKNVQASHLLSDWPVLSANIQMRNLNLEPLTQTFSFGRISGRLDGKVSNLKLENWSPTAFDADFVTSPKSANRRISQQAVDNISNLGGVGMAGALSRSFLRFFEDFGYDKLGIGCKLRDGVCEMNGVESADKGYYLVKGSGLPQINVIGYNKSTDWNILINRLSAISQSGAPTVN